MAHAIFGRSFIHRSVIAVVVIGAASASACAVGTHDPSGSGTNDGLQTDGGTGDDSGLSVDGTGSGTDGTPVIYAHSDDSLYAMDPSTKSVTLIGQFTGGTGGMTDCAVDGNGNLFINSTSAVYAATLPAGGKGSVALALKTSLPTGSKFYALGFTPAGVLEADRETLIAGDGSGDLYWIDTTGPSTTPVKLGIFGPWLSGDPGPGRSGDLWTLSGDILFYMDGSTPRGLATLRSCYSTSGSTSTKCENTNDVFAEIDMTALKTAFDTKSPTNVRKRIIGSGSGVGSLFGAGAWDDKFYAFSRSPAQLVQFDSTGASTVINEFPSITNGWSGACVTTKAKITVIK
jgi:hypothetical protein